MRTAPLQIAQSLGVRDACEPQNHGQLSRPRVGVLQVAGARALGGFAGGFCSGWLFAAGSFVVDAFFMNLFCCWLALDGHI